MTPVIEFSQVSRSFQRRQRAASIQERFIGLLRGLPAADEFYAVRDVSFRIAAGESFGLVGHNGAGKSTMLKLMTRVLAPSSGTIRTRGRIAALIELGSGFHPELSGRENVYLYGSLMGINRRDLSKRMPEIVEFSEIGEFLDTPVKHYSSGMYTRLAFSVATAVDPDVLITDEVLAVGDEAFQRKCLDRIFSFRRAGKTIIYVSHALDTVEALCDTAIWLDHGRMQRNGPAAEVVSAYLQSVDQQERSGNRANSGGPDPAQRQGSGDVEITAVELLGGDEQPAAVAETERPLIIRMHYVAHRPIKRPVFGVGIFHEGGLWLSGPNSGFDNVQIDEIRGGGVIDYRIEALPLLAGRYRISVAATDESGLYTYDLHDRAYGLTVQNNANRQRYGVLMLQGNWQQRD
jgi:lipopolysaccharide transport system ATP-binding protein